MRDDPQVQQEVARLALESLASSAIDAIGGDGDFPQFLPTLGFVLNIGQPNAETGAGRAYLDLNAVSVDEDDRYDVLLEVEEPAHCPYRSLILTNEIYETIDWYNNHSSLNGSQAPVDKDGILRIVVSAKDPGVPNWLDTAGHPKGVIQGRWTDCDSQPIPTIRRVELAQVRSFLPAETPGVTPEERDAIIRERRGALLQRPHW